MHTPKKATIKPTARVLNGPRTPIKKKKTYNDGSSTSSGGSKQNSRKQSSKQALYQVNKVVAKMTDLRDEGKRLARTTNELQKVSGKDSHIPVRKGKGGKASASSTSSKRTPAQKAYFDIRSHLKNLVELTINGDPTSQLAQNIGNLKKFIQKNNASETRKIDGKTINKQLTDFKFELSDEIRNYIAHPKIGFEEIMAIKRTYNKLEEELQNLKKWIEDEERANYKPKPDPPIVMHSEEIE